MHTLKIQKAYNGHCITYLCSTIYFLSDFHMPFFYKLFQVLITEFLGSLQVRSCGLEVRSDVDGDGRTGFEIVDRKAVRCSHDNSYSTLI